MTTTNNDTPSRPSSPEPEPMPIPVFGDKGPVSGPPEGSLRVAMRARWRGFVAWPLLAVMAGADGFGFWNTLVTIIQRDTQLIKVFVVAMSVGAVWVPHEVGRYARSRRSGYGGSLVWMAVLALVWLALGGTMAWLRATGQGASLFGGGSDSFGDLDTGADPQQLHIAVLLAVLYLMTGALAIGHGYRWSDPRASDLRDIYRQRAKRVKKVIDREFDEARTRGRLQHLRDERARDDAARTRGHELGGAYRDAMGNLARRYMAEGERDPASTDALTNHPQPIPPPRPGRPASSTDLPEI